jgi:hypothetical protein
LLASIDLVTGKVHALVKSARKTIFPLTRERRIGTLLMFAVRSIFAKPERVAVAMREAAAKGQVEKWLGRRTSRSPS